MKKFIELIYGSTELKMTFDVPIDKAVERLESNVDKSLFSRMKSEGMAGRVSKNRIAIQRVIPNIGNSFKPFFIGSLSTVNEKTTLSGVFRIHLFSQAILTIWFGGTLFWIIGTTLLAIQKPSEAWFFPIFGVLQFAAGYGLVRLCKWFSRNDEQWLKEKISDAINQTPASN